MDREKVVKGLNDIGGFIAGRIGIEQARNFLRTIDEAIAILKEQEAIRCKNCRNNHQCAIQFKFADADDEENWFCKDFTPSSGQAVKWE